MDYPIELLNKLDAESEAINQSLSTLPSSDSIGLVKQHAERKLLALTPKAIDTLDAGMDASQTKDRLAAASRVLDLSPATRPQVASFGEQSIPLDAIKELMTGLSNMFRGAKVQFASTPYVEPDPYSSVKEDLVEAPDQSSRTA